jgi:hypothetical protein
MAASDEKLSNINEQLKLGMRIIFAWNDVRNNAKQFRENGGKDGRAE